MLPGALQLPRLQRLTEVEEDFARDPVLRLAALLPDGDEAAHAAADALKLSNADRLRMEQALSGEVAVPLQSAQEARRLLYRIGAARFKDRLLLQWAGAPPAQSGAWRMLLEMADSWQRPRFVLTGRDVMQAGVPEGPDVGRLLAQVEDWWIGGDFTADEAALRARLAAVIAQDRA